MEVTALCIRLWMTVLLLLCAPGQRVDSVSLRVEPNKLQFFEYEPVTFHCDGSSGWKVARNATSGFKCKTRTESSCTIKNVYAEDSGEYWCEDGEGERSSSINITVTAASVILESPALPVTEGDGVTLRCRNRTTSSDLLTGFYKDGVLVRNSSTGNMTILRVSESDEGLYKCKVSDGESAESRLTVTERDHKEEETNHGSTSPPSSGSTPWIIVSVLLMILLLAVGLRQYGRALCDTVLLYLSRLKPAPGSAEGQTAQVEAGAAGEDKQMYATVRKTKKKKANPPHEGELVSSPVYYTLGADEAQQPAEPGTGALYTLASGVTTQPLTEDAYATVP